MDAQQKPEEKLLNPQMPAPVREPKAIDPVREEPATAQRLANVEQQMSSFERATLRWAGAAVILSGLAAIFVCAQWLEMHEGGKDTHDLAVAAGSQATWTQRLADSAKIQSDKTQTLADRTKDLADRMKDQADRTKTVADQAVIQSNANKKLAQNAVDTLANTKQSFRDEQRAWIGVQGTADSKGFTETQPWQVTIVFFNSGRTPAHNVQTSVMYTTSPIPLAGPSPQQIAMLHFWPAQSIAPQGYYRESIANFVGGEISAPEQVVGQQTLISQFAQIKGRQLFLYYFGLLKYEDTFGQPHETEFCILLSNPDTKEVGMCDKFNDLN